MASTMGPSLVAVSNSSFTFPTRMSPLGAKIDVIAKGATLLVLPAGLDLDLLHHGQDEAAQTLPRPLRPFGLRRRTQAELMFQRGQREFANSLPRRILRGERRLCRRLAGPQASVTRLRRVALSKKQGDCYRRLRHCSSGGRMLAKRHASAASTSERSGVRTNARAPASLRS